MCYCFFVGEFMKICYFIIISVDFSYLCIVLEFCYSGLIVVCCCIERKKGEKFVKI